MQQAEVLRYLPFSSQIDLNFWHKFCDKKLNELKLSEDPVEFCGEFDNNLTIGQAVASVSYAAFTGRPESFAIRGKLLNKNSIETFKSCDKKLILENAVQSVIDEIKSGRALDSPERLTQMSLLSFADLKKYHFYYWCMFPSLSIPNSQLKISNLTPITETLSTEQLVKFAQSCSGKQFLLLDKTSLAEVPMSTLKVSSEFYVGFADPSGSTDHVGWPLRNFLLMIAYWMSKDEDEFEVISIRGSKQLNFDRSRSFRVRLKKITFTEPDLSYVGWEKNEKQQFGPRFLNLSSSMDPKALAGSAVDLNLKLMRWRLAPDLDLKKISDTKCLLLGSGTLGCNVARCLMGWGVRHITFVDNGKVSYSNPVRQSLFTFDDSLKGGKPKAQAAAESARQIYPGIDANHVQLSIPMPGHSVAESSLDEVRKSVDQLEQLVQEHDAIFLLLDTREARWLPTVLGAKYDKIVMNAALGFDTFLVMRHGSSKNKLGCYFCNDVVGPSNSTRDRTLDQQCTVSRPGVSYLAASLAVELMVTLLQHDQGVHAPADDPCEHEDEVEGSTNVLGLAPHQIRCFLSQYNFMTPTSHAFHMCTACSPAVVNAYAEKGFEFLARVFNEDGFLEEFTGLAEMQRMTQEVDILALDDSDNDISI